MRIVAVYYTHKRGGFCKRLYRLLNALAQGGHEVTYYSLDRPPESLSSAVNCVPIPFPLRARKGLFFWGLFLLWTPLFLLLAVARNGRPERYLAFSSFYATLSLPARWYSYAPCVLFLRSLSFQIDRITGKPRWLRAITETVEKIGLRSADEIVCMTSAMQREVELFLGKELPNVQILPNEVTLQPAGEREALRCQLLQRLSCSESPLVCLTSGVLDQRKNISFLIEAFALLREQITPNEIILLVAGSGPLEQELRTQQARHPRAFLHFLGWQEEMTPLYHSADLVLHPALHEGVPNSVLEALGHHLPVLVSDTPEHTEILPAEELRFHLSKPDTLTEKLTSILRDQSEREKITALSKSCAEKLVFDWEKAAVEIIEAMPNVVS
ncbi:glycosyltransferase family 4 protein [bacterium]|nr:glycosyltransferase family 4 protein [bacterium]